MATEPITYPPVIINEYLSEKVAEKLSDRFYESLKFFPTLPTDLNALTESFPEASQDVFAVYDRMFKMRRMPFPHIKCEQLLYYFNALEENAVPNLIRITQKIQDFLDRGDESAEDLNAWILSTLEVEIETETLRPVATIPGHGTFYVPYFHNFKIYQLEETRDIIDFGTARTYAGNKMIIDYDWHAVYPDLNKP